ncbi:MAG: hypothetical protein R3B09_10460 [Nannocystaceae bacterium]
MDPIYKDALLGPLDADFARIDLGEIVGALVQIEDGGVRWALEHNEDFGVLHRLEQGEVPSGPRRGLRHLDLWDKPAGVESFLALSVDLMSWATTPSEPDMTDRKVAGYVAWIRVLVRTLLRDALVRLVVRVTDLRAVKPIIGEQLLAPLLEEATPTSLEAGALRQRLADVTHELGDTLRRDEFDFLSLRILRMRGDDEAYVRECLRLGLRHFIGDELGVASTWSAEARRHAGAARTPVSASIWSVLEYLDGLLSIAHDRLTEAEARFQAAAAHAVTTPMGPVPGLAVMVAFSICARARGAAQEELAWLGRALTEGVRTRVPPSSLAYVHDRLHRLHERAPADTILAATALEDEGSGVSSTDLLGHLLEEAIERGDPAAVEVIATEIVARAGSEDVELLSRAYEGLAALAEREGHWDQWATASERQIAATSPSDRERAVGFLRLAEEAEERGLLDHAERWYRRVIEHGGRSGHQAACYSALQALAELVGARGDRAASAAFTAQAEALARAELRGPMDRPGAPVAEPPRGASSTDTLGQRSRGYRGVGAAPERDHGPSAIVLQTTRAALDPGVVRFTPLDRLPALLRDLPPRLDDAACLLDALLERKADPDALEPLHRQMQLDDNDFADVVALAAWIRRDEPTAIGGLPVAVSYPDLEVLGRLASPAFVEHWIRDLEPGASRRGRLAALSLAYAGSETLAILARIFDRAPPGTRRDRLQGVLLLAIAAKLARGDAVEEAIERVVDVRGCSTPHALRRRDFVVYHLPILRAILAALPRPRRSRVLLRMLDRANPFWVRAADLFSADDEAPTIARLFAFLDANADGICEVEEEWVAGGLYRLGEAARAHVEAARRSACHPLLRLGLARWPGPPSEAPLDPLARAEALRALSERVVPDGVVAYLIVQGEWSEAISISRVGGRPIGVDERRWPRAPATLHNDDRMIHLLTLDLTGVPGLRAWHPWLRQAAALAIFVADVEPTATPEGRRAEVIPLDDAMLGLGEYEGRIPGERYFGHMHEGTYLARAEAVDTRAARIVELRAPRIDPFAPRADPAEDDEVPIADEYAALRYHFDRSLERLIADGAVALALADMPASPGCGVPLLLFNDPATHQWSALAYRGGRFFVH